MITCRENICRLSSPVRSIGGLRCDVTRTTSRHAAKTGTILLACFKSTGRKQPSEQASKQGHQERRNQTHTHTHTDQDTPGCGTEQTQEQANQSTTDNQPDRQPTAIKGEQTNKNQREEESNLLLFLVVIALDDQDATRGTIFGCAC